MTSATMSCSNSACRVSEDGKCVEGYAVDACPHASTLVVSSIAEVPSTPSRLVVELGIPLEQGHSLDRGATSRLLRRYPARVVAVIGPNDSGKTSLIAGVYDCIQVDCIAGARFAGSSTLLGFEVACHHSRAASGRSVAHTERTSLGEDAKFFHLDLRRQDEEVLSLLIADRSGEDYLQIINQLSTAKAFFELRRADTLALLVDGEQLLKSSERQEVRSVTLQLVRSLLEAGSTRQGTRLAIVMTKYDSVIASPHAERAICDLAMIVEGIRRLHGGHFGEVEPFQVAASPKIHGGVQRGDGVSSLVDFWIRALPEPAHVKPIRTSSAGRMIDQFDMEADE